MTSAFQAGAFQINAFQINVPTYVNAGGGGQGGLLAGEAGLINDGLVK
jgi:hypothetical protein